jgi:hypothetical protein
MSASDSSNINEGPPPLLSPQQQQQPPRRTMNGNNGGGASSGTNGFAFHRGNGNGNGNTNSSNAINNAINSTINNSIHISNSLNPNNPNYNGTNTQYGLPDYGNTNYGQDCSGVNIDRKDCIDSALIAALRDPKERDALLNLESALVQFMQSPAGWVEISGPYNSQFWTGGDTPANMKRERHSSFQRCVLHRLADRFWIIREPGQIIGALRLIKVPNSAIPPVLLNHLTDIEVAEALSRIGMAPLLSPPTLPPSYSFAAAASQAVPAVATTPTATTTPEPVAMKIIMKRTNSQPISGDDDDKLGPNGSANGANNGSSNNKASTSITEKEKAYAAARARIFNEQPSASTSTTTSATTSATTTTAATSYAERAGRAFAPSSLSLTPSSAVNPSSSSAAAAVSANAATLSARTTLTAEAPVFVPRQQTPSVPVSSSSTSSSGPVSSSWLLLRDDPSLSR